MSERLADAGAKGGTVAIALLAIVALSIAAGLGFVLGQLRRRPGEQEIVQLLRHQGQKLDSLAERVNAVPRTQPNDMAGNQALDVDGLVARLHAMRCDGPVGQTAAAQARPPNQHDVEEQAQAYEKARTLVDGAIANKVWKDTDAAEFRGVVGRLSASQSEEILSRLIPALNGGQVAVRTSGPPL